VRKTRSESSERGFDVMPRASSSHVPGATCRDIRRDGHAPGLGDQPPVTTERSAPDNLSGHVSSVRGRLDLSGRFRG
jgi:hypothetical protein